MALGATAAGISRMVLLSIWKWTLAGTIVGLAGAWFGAKLVESLLFGVRPHDPLLLGMAVVVLLVVALLAAWAPALRAAKVDPMVVLRYE